MVTPAERNAMSHPSDGPGRAGRHRARRLRARSTDAERLIWQELRAHRLNGFGFRRQHPIGPYIVDFICLAAGLVVEVDGGQHFTPAGLSRDARRDAYLASMGLRMLRLSNLDVLHNLPGVLETLLEAVSHAAGAHEPHSLKHSLRRAGEAQDKGLSNAPAPPDQMTDGEA